VKTPRLDVLQQVARQCGLKTIQDEGILLLVKGVTSLPELQRILQQG
jgi:type II secretory ATPase GspE/PulE/Tfp pilus assembly ATPase PilB-like protein